MGPERGDTQPQRRADELEREADRLERHGEEVDERIAETREGWRRKQADDAVPGAQPPVDEET